MLLVARTLLGPFWPYYYRSKKLLGTKGIATRSKRLLDDEHSSKWLPL